MPALTRGSEKRLPLAWAVLLAVAVCIVMSIRVRLLDLPLERDEGEYAYAGQLLLGGLPPYQLAYNMKFPGTYAAYAILMAVFGQTIAGVRLGLLLVNAATIAVVFFLGRRLVNFTAGAAAAACYAILSVSPSLLGFAGHATHFVVLPVLGGALLLLRSPPSSVAVAASGVLFGLGVLMKQPAVFYLLFGVGFLFRRDHRDGLRFGAKLARAALFAAAALIPLVLTALLLWRAGVFEKFWFWTIVYAREYGTLISFAEGGQLFAATMRSVLASGWPVWALAACGLAACVWKAELRQRAFPFLLAFLGCSALAICPGFYFRQHYFLLALPAICLLAGTAIAMVETMSARLRPVGRFMPMLLLAAACAWPLVADRGFFLAPDPITASRMIFGTNPFPESVRIGEYLAAQTSPTDKIAVLGSEPQIYFYARRQSATGYIYTYGLMEPHDYAEQMQREMVAELEAARPKYLVVVRVPTSWLARSDTGNLIFDWFGDYGLRNYHVVGLANILPGGTTDYHFPVDLRRIELSASYILVYERNL